MKNSTLKFILLISVALNIAILGAVFYSYYGNPLHMLVPFGHGPGKRAFLVRELSLNPDQAKVWEENEQSFHGDIDKIRQQIFQKRMALLDLMRADKPDEKGINRIISEIGDMQESIQKKIVAHIIEVKAMLNKDQQKKFFGLIENAITKKEDRHAPHGPRH
jgi:Spy/CpxP family protein refolding chaperone